jgi:hypothetical protein
VSIGVWLVIAVIVAIGGLTIRVYRRYDAGYENGQTVHESLRDVLAEAWGPREYYDPAEYDPDGDF